MAQPILDTRDKTLVQTLIGSQAFWVTVALVIISVVMSVREPVFASQDNFFNITRNFAFIGIMALGMTPVIITGGIDLSVGSVMGVVAIVCGLILLKTAYSLDAGLVERRRLDSFLVDGDRRRAGGGRDHRLHQRGAHRLCGPAAFRRDAGDAFDRARGSPWCFRATGCSMISGRARQRSRSSGGGDSFGLPLPFRLSNPFLILIILTIVLATVLKVTAWGRHIFAVGGNEHAANLTGVPVKRLKVQAYVLCSLSAALAAILSVGWSGSANNSLGQSYELLAIASAVIGGANLMGGEGGAYGAFIGSALIFVIRNSLLMAGVDSNWQGLFVGSFIILAVVLERVRGKRRE